MDLTGYYIGYFISALTFISIGYAIGKSATEKDTEKFLDSIDDEYSKCDNLSLAYTKWNPKK